METTVSAVLGRNPLISSIVVLIRYGIRFSSPWTESFDKKLYNSVHTKPKPFQQSLDGIL